MKQGGATNSKKESRKFKNKKELIDWVKHQLNIELAMSEFGNTKRNILYTEIKSPRVFSLLSENNMRYESHLKDFYWIWIK